MKSVDCEEYAGDFRFLEKLTELFARPLCRF